MPISESPKIDDVDPQTGKPKYANFAEYQDARDKWNRAETLRELRQQPGAGSSSTGWGTALAGYAFLALLVYAGWIGISWAGDALKGHSVAKASAPDPRDQQIKELSDKIAALEAKPVEHHYELRNEGTRSFRFDPTTGESCIQLASKADWKNPETMRQSCTYQDYLTYHPADTNAYLKAECIYVGTVSACHTLGWDSLSPKK